MRKALSSPKNIICITLHMLARNKFKGVNSIKFNKRFRDDEDYYEYFSLIKWENWFAL